ncbi:MAG: metallophosphoesterase family protein [Actinomycetes bacterium]
MSKRTSPARLRTTRAIGIAWVTVAIVSACTTGEAASPSTTPPKPKPRVSSPTVAPSPTPTDSPKTAADRVVVALAGDIADDDGQDEATASLLEGVDPDLVLTLGDHAYPDGTRADYAAQYTPTWGRFRDRTRPAPGNHDYHDEAGNPPYYYTYFAGQLPDQNGGRFYALDAGRWRIYSLNCEIDCSESSPQVAWLRADLAATGAGRHKLAYLHRPRYSCGTHGSYDDARGLWRALVGGRVDVIASGHDHNYQRYPRMDADGQSSPSGAVSFVAGTGGAGRYKITGYEDEEGCDLASYTTSDDNGVLVMALEAGRFSWHFLTTDGSALDAGTMATLDGPR